MCGGQKTRLVYGGLGVLALFFLAIAVVAVVAGAHAYKTGYLLLAFGIVGFAVPNFLLVYWYFNDRVDDSVGRLAYAQLFVLLLVCIGVVLADANSSPAQYAISSVD